MTARREPVIVILVAVASFGPVMIGIALLPPPSTAFSLPGPWCAQNSTPYPGSTPLAPQSPVLLPRSDTYNLSAAGAQPIRFSLDAPADFSGSWESTLPVDLFVLNVSWCTLGPPLPPGQLNGTFNVSLFPGNYGIFLEGFDGSRPAAVLTITQSWTATFDRGLDVLQAPEEVSLPPNGHTVWSLAAPSSASRFFLEDAMETNSCDFELAMLPPAAYRAFASGEGPLNGSGATLIDGWNETVPSGSVPCGPSTGAGFLWCDVGPFNWTSGDVAVFYNAADYTATLDQFAPLEASYLTG